jgi:hypothetical protein
VRIYSNEALRNHQKGSLVQVFKERICGEQINTLILGFNFSIAKDPKRYINELILDTEKAIRYLDAKIQDTCKCLATRNI